MNKEVIQLVELLFFGSIVFMGFGLWLTLVSSMVYGVLCLLFPKLAPKKLEASEPGQTPKKFKRAVVEKESQAVERTTEEVEHFDDAEQADVAVRVSKVVPVRKVTSTSPSSALEDRLANEFDAQQASM